MLNAKNKMLFSTLISMLFPVLTTQYICKNSEKSYALHVLPFVNEIMYMNMEYYTVVNTSKGST